MINLKIFASALEEVAEERGVPPQKVLQVIESALASAYKKEYGSKRQHYECKLNPKTGELKFWQVKEVVNPEEALTEKEITKQGQTQEKTEDKNEKKFRFDPERHITLEEARKINPKAEPGQELKIPVETKQDFGRIASQVAKQVLLQKIKDVEREETYKEYKAKEGELVSGIVQRIEGDVVFLDIGKTTGILPKKEQMKEDEYRPGQRLKCYVLKVEKEARGPVIILSRVYPKLVSKLFELEVPEIAAKQVEIKSLVREPGSRTKVAVAALERGVDPIGSMVGQRGTRIWAVINELNGEKIDVIEWSDDPKQYIANALSPAKVLEVKILPKNKAQVVVPDDQLSLAIGRDGQNVRLAANLTGWKIDVRSLSQVEEGEKTNHKTESQK